MIGKYYTRFDYPPTDILETEYKGRVYFSIDEGQTWYLKGKVKGGENGKESDKESFEERST